MVEPMPETRIVLPKVRRPVGRPPKHGAYSGAELARLVPLKRQAIMDVLSGNAAVVGKADGLVVEMLAGVLAKIDLFDNNFKAYGVFNAEGGVRQDALKVYLAAINLAVRICAQLGMTPESRLKLGLSIVQLKGDLATLMNDAGEEPK